MIEKRLAKRMLLWSSLGLAVAISLAYLTYDFARSERVGMMLQSARSYSTTLTALRHFYSQEIVSTYSSSDSPISFSHKYKTEKNSLPLPATLTIELSKYISEHQPDTQFGLVSAFPFKNRSNRQLSPFTIRALKILDDKASQDYYETDYLPSGQIRLSFAQVVVMDRDCVACHNKHMDSVRRDWKIGDIRGIQQIIMTSQDSITTVLTKMAPLLASYLIALGLTLIASYHYAARSRKTVEQLKQSAKGEQRKSKELRYATNRLLQVEGYLSDAIEALPDGFVLYDKNDQLVMCNEKYREIYKTSADLIVPGARFEDIIRTGVERGQYPAAKNDPESWIARRMEFHYHPTAPIEQKLDDGRWLRVFEQQTENGQFVGFRVDITELKDREQALSDSESQLRATMESALDGIIIINSDGIIREFNKSASRIFGYQQDEALGQNMSELIIPAKLRQAHTDGLNHYLKTGEGPVLGKRITVPGLHKDGHEITLELAINPAQSNSEQLFIAYMRDITEELAKQEALKEAKHAAEQAAKAKSAFLAIMSHEIRTPLNGLLGLLELLQERSANPKDQKQISTALESAEALTRLLNDILDYSKLEEGKLDVKYIPIELKPFLEQVMDLLKPIFERKQLSTHLSVDPALPETILGDPLRLRQILINLLGNAAKFTPQGFVHLKVTKSVGSNQTEKLQFLIADSGIGISEQDIPQLFERFNTLDASYAREQEGSGLGLSITKSLCDLMDGTISVESQLHHGSTFKVKLPLLKALRHHYAAEDKHGSHSQNIGTSDQLEDKKILLAEDNPTNNLVLTTMLTSIGASVTSVENGQQALDAAATEAFDLYILDISMPVMDGVDTIKHLRTNQTMDQPIPALAFTAYTSKDETTEFMAAGFDDILNKPARKRDVLSKIDKLLEIQRQTSLCIPDNEQQISTSPATLLDTNVITPLFADLPIDLHAKLRSNCLSDLKSSSMAILDAINVDEWQAVHAHTHRLKGVASTFGLQKLAHFIAPISDKTKIEPDKAEQDHIKIQLQGLPDLLDQTLSELEQFFAIIGTSTTGSNSQEEQSQ